MAEETLPPGVLPNITDTDPPPLHPDTIVGDGHVGAPPGCVDVPHVMFDGLTLTCTQGNWTGTPTAYAYKWQMGSETVGSDAPTYAVQPADDGKIATCIVTATNGYGSTEAQPSNAIQIGSSGSSWSPGGGKPDAPPGKPPESEPESHPDHPEHRRWLERMGRSGRGERHK